MKRYPNSLPPVDHRVSLTKPPRPGPAIVLSGIAEQHGWRASDHWHYEPGSYANPVFMLLLTHPDRKLRLEYAVEWKRRQPTFDLGWWSRGKVVQCPPAWPRIGDCFGPRMGCSDAVPGGS